MFDFGYGMAGGSMYIIWLIFWFLAFLGLALFVKNQWECSKARKGTSAIEILKIRYAKGDINKEEFEEKMKDLI